VITTAVHENKILEMNADGKWSCFIVPRENCSAPCRGEWVIEQILSGDDDVRFAHARSHPRAPLAVKVRYTTRKANSSTA